MEFSKGTIFHAICLLAREFRVECKLNGGKKHMSSLAALGIFFASSPSSREENASFNAQ